MDLEQITDYGEVGKNLTPSRFKGKSGYEGQMSAYDKQLNDIEAANYSLYVDMWIDTSFGESLDFIGDIVDIARNGRDDESYRVLIKLKIKINVGAGQPELVLEVVRELYKPTETEYIPNYPAGFSIRQNGSLGLFILDTMKINTGEDFIIDDESILCVRQEDTTALNLIDLVIPSGVEGIIETLTDFVIDNGTPLLLDEGSPLQVRVV